MKLQCQVGEMMIPNEKFKCLGMILIKNLFTGYWKIIASFLAVGFAVICKDWRRQSLDITLLSSTTRLVGC